MEEDVFRSFGALRKEESTMRAVGDLHHALDASGFVSTDTAEETFHLVFNDEEGLWTWMWSHGTRRLLEAVAVDRLDALKRALFDGLANCKERDGMIHGRLNATVARAVAP
jgi:hypothetical protein